MNDGKFGDPKTPGVALTVPETFHFLMTNWMPRDVVADMAFECPDMLRNIEFPSGKPGLN